MSEVRKVFDFKVIKRGMFDPAKYIRFRCPCCSQPHETKLRENFPEAKCMKCGKPFQVIVNSSKVHVAESPTEQAVQENDEQEDISDVISVSPSKRRTTEYESIEAFFLGMSYLNVGAVVVLLLFLTTANIDKSLKLWIAASSVVEAFVAVIAASCIVKFFRAFMELVNNSEIIVENMTDRKTGQSAK